MEAEKRKLVHIAMPLSLRIKLSNLMRIRGHYTHREAENIDPIKDADPPSMSEVIRDLIEEAHKHEVQGH